MSPGQRVRTQVEIEIKYQGYIREEEEMASRFKKSEALRIPEELDYTAISGLKREEVEKLSSIRPVNLGQVSRIPGVRPAAVQILMVNLKKN